MNFGVPQGSILDPVLFNIYVAYLHEIVNVKCFQYADDTKIYDHAKISDLNNCRNTISQSINKLSAWSKQSTLAFNNDKTKVMILSTPQMSRVHHLDEYDPNIVKQECRKELRSSNSIRLVVPTENSTFQDNASKLFNNLPESIRNFKGYRPFLRLSRNFLCNRVQSD